MRTAFGYADLAGCYPQRLHPPTYRRWACQPSSCTAAPPLVLGGRLFLASTAISRRFQALGQRIRSKVGLCPNSAPREARAYASTTSLFHGCSGIIIPNLILVPQLRLLASAVRQSSSMAFGLIPPSGWVPHISSSNQPRGNLPPPLGERPISAWLAILEPACLLAFPSTPRWLHQCTVHR